MARTALHSRLHASRRRTALGLSLIELLIGMTVALFIAAQGATALAAHLREQRAVSVETRLMQDLRTTADLIARDLRRAGYWAAADAGVWSDMRAGGTAAAARNPYATALPGGAASDAVTFRYSRDAVENGVVDGNEQFGFRLRAGVIEMQLGAGNWQALTDAGTLVVTEFRLTPATVSIPLDEHCPVPCPPGATGCPVHEQRSIGVVLTGRAVADARVVRRLQVQARLRNDSVRGDCAG